MKESTKKNWADFKKNLTINNIKAIFCALVPLIGYLYLWHFWFLKTTDLMQQYAASATAIDQELVVLCIAIGSVAPLLFGIKAMNFGLWLGYITHFYHNNLTNTLIFDDISYSLRDMPNEEREKLKGILSKYKKDKKKNV